MDRDRPSRLGREPIGRASGNPIHDEEDIRRLRSDGGQNRFGYGLVDEYFLCGEPGDEEGGQSGMAKNMVLAAKLEDWTREEMKKEGWVK